ncbi:MAG: NAD-dependent epimerase/dehydratase family protein [Candidatus Gastranaerophilaceae bacterium]
MRTSLISTISNNHIIQEDLESSANCKCFDITKLKNKTILVTGVTGFIGKQLVLTLLCMNTVHNLNINIIAMARNKDKVKTLFHNVLNDKNLNFCIQDSTENINISNNVDFIIHCANPVTSRVFVEHPVETIEAITLGTNNILKFAKEKKVESVVYLSSMEVYGIIDIPSIKESDYGYIDPLNIRSSYSEGKRLAETLCVSYCSEYKVPVKIIRLSQVFGAGLDYNDSRVLSQFIRSVIEKKDIVLHTEGKTVLTNCYISDAINGIFTVLLEGQNGESYNLANSKNVFSIKQIAELIVQNNSTSKVILDIQNVSQYRPDTILKINTDKINALGWIARIGLKEMISRTISSYMEERITIGK